MYAQVGDRMVVRNLHVGEVVRDGEIIEVPHADGSPPYLVRWSDDEHTSLFFPGPDAYVQHFHHTEAPAGAEAALPHT